MSMIYRSETVTVLHDVRGFVEWIVRERQMPTIEELHEVGRRLVAQGFCPARVLVARLNKYTAPEDFNILDIGHGDFSISRLAYFAPAPSDRIFSQLMSATALRNVPAKVFLDREAAISWLLAEA